MEEALLGIDEEVLPWDKAVARVVELTGLPDYKVKWFLEKKLSSRELNET
jgi:hypothetical protein